MTDAVARHNPFATRFVRPGAIGYLFPDDASPESLVDRLRQNRWHGEIVGPHGVGKSTLLATFVPRLIDAGRMVVNAALRGGERSLPSSLDAWREWNENTQVVVDGYEQLSWWARRKLSRRVKERGAGLLVTSHAPTGLPLLIEVSPRLDVAEQVVRSLVSSSEMISRDDIHQAFQDCGGNLRETLFRLYDLYENRVREGMGARE
jgi:hypothetical protein